MRCLRALDRNESEKMRTGKILIAALFVLLISGMGFAASISISQAGADAGTVMKSNAFTATVSGLSSSGSVALTLPTGFSTTESTSKSYGEGTTSVSWTTVIADQKLTGQTISATITIAGSPETVQTSSFDVVLPPSFVSSASPSSFSATNQTGTYYANITFNVQNWGETTANDVVATIAPPSGMSLVSGYSAAQSIGTISGGPGGSGESKGVSWRLSASSSVSGNIAITLTSSNADSSAISIPTSIAFLITATTVASVSDSPSGSQTTTTTILPRKVQTWSSMAAGAEYNITNFEMSMPLRTITIRTSGSASNVRITITSLSAKPSSIVGNANGSVYKYFDITSENLSSSSINFSKIVFDVEKVWISSNSLDKNSVILSRYYNNTWNELQTSYLNSTSNYHIYEAITPGFSTFAISAKALVATTTTVSGTNLTQNATTQQGFDVSSLKGFLEENYGWAITAAVILMAVVIYLKRASIRRFLEKRSTKPWEKSASRL